MVSLDESHAQTQMLLANGDVSAAAQAFNTGFFATVKKLYAEAGETYPVRYSKASNWCIWTKQLYIHTAQVDKMLSEGQVREASAGLDMVLAYFYTRHADTGTEKTSDILYAFHEHVHEDPIPLEQLVALRVQLDSVDLSALADQDRDAYHESKRKWAKRADKALKKRKLGGWGRRKLRKATDEFHAQYPRLFQ